MIEITIPGKPVPKGRPRISVIRGKPHAFTPEATRAAEEAMRWHLKSAWSGGVDDESWFAVECWFYVPKLTRSTRRGDGDNLMKLVCDAATGIVWKDDAQVLDWIARVREGEPCTHIRIERMAVRDLEIAEGKGAA